MVIEGGHIGDLLSVKDDLPVGLVGDQKEGIAELFGLPAQDLCKPCQGLFRIDGARRIVGGVDQKGRHTGGQLSFQVLEVDLEGLCIRLHDPDPGARLGNIGIIFREEGGKDNDLVSGCRYGPEGMGNGAGRTGRGEDMLSLIVHAESFI